MYLFHIGLHKVSLGTLILALGLLGGRCHHRGRDHGREARAGLRSGASGGVRLHQHGVSHAHRHAGHRLGFSADRAREIRRPANTPARYSRFRRLRCCCPGWRRWSSFRCSAIGFCPSIRPGGRSVTRMRRPLKGDTHQPHDVYDGRFYRRLRGWIAWCIDHRGLVLGVTAGAVRAGSGGVLAGAAAVLSELGAPRAAWSTCGCRKAPHSLRRLREAQRFESDLKGRPRNRSLRRLRRSRRAALLPAARSAARDAQLRAVRGDRQRVSKSASSSPAISLRSCDTKYSSLRTRIITARERAAGRVSRCSFA